MGGSDNGRLLERKPEISKEVVDWLDRSFPLVSPKLTESEREIFYRVGQRAVVDHLIALFNEQNDNLLSSED